MRVGDVPGPQLSYSGAPPEPLADVLKRPKRREDWAVYIGLDPARAPDGDWCACAINVLHRLPTRPWVPVPAWAGEVRGVSLVEVFDQLSSTQLKRDFRWLAIDATHDPTLADMAEREWPGRVRAIKYTNTQKEAMWKDYYTFQSWGRKFPTETGDPRLDEVYRKLAKQVDRYTVDFTPSGKLRLDHRRGEHDDLLDADMMSCHMAMLDVKKGEHVLEFSSVEVAQAGVGVEAAPGGHDPRSRGDILADRYAQADWEALGA